MTRTCAHRTCGYPGILLLLCACHQISVVCPSGRLTCSHKHYLAKRFAGSAFRHFISFLLASLGFCSITNDAKACDGCNCDCQVSLLFGSPRRGLTTTCPTDDWSCSQQDPTRCGTFQYINSSEFSRFRSRHVFSYFYYIYRSFTLEVLGSRQVNI